MKIKNTALIFLSSVFLFSASCKQHKALQKAKDEAKPIVVAPTFSLHDSVVAHTFKFHTMTAKIKMEFKGNDGSEIGLMVSMRAVHDSAIWMSASPALGIEAARILFTPDSIKIMDKLHGEYAVESYSFLRKYTQAEITFDILQNIFTGNPAFMNDSLATDSVTNIFQAHNSQNGLLQTMYINKIFRIIHNMLTDENTGDFINVFYGDFQYVETEYFPFDIHIDAHSKDKMVSILMNYSNVSVNAPVELRFNIPSSYTKMKY